MGSRGPVTFLVFVNSGDLLTKNALRTINHLYKKTFNIPEAIVQEDKKVIPGLDGRKMSKSYNNIIPLLSDEKTLKKSIAKIFVRFFHPDKKINPSFTSKERAILFWNFSHASFKNSLFLIAPLPKITFSTPASVYFWILSMFLTPPPGK